MVIVTSEDIGQFCSTVIESCEAYRTEIHGKLHTLSVVMRIPSPDFYQRAARVERILFQRDAALCAVMTVCHDIHEAIALREEARFDDLIAAFRLAESRGIRFQAVASDEETIRVWRFLHEVVSPHAAEEAN